MCNHKMLKRKIVNQTSLPNPELIQIWDYRKGDFNDVYSSIDVRGTGSQLDEMCKDSLKGYRNVEDFGDGESFGYQTYYPNGEVKFYAEATATGTDKTDLRSWTTFVDLVKEGA